MGRHRKRAGTRGTRPKSDGRWWGYYYDARGKKRYVYGATPDERDQRLHEALAQRDRQVVPDRASVGAVVDTWLERRAERVAPSTATNYRYLLGLLPDWLRAIKVTELTADDVDEALAGLLRTHASSTVASVRARLGQVLRQQERRGRVARNAAMLSERVAVDEKPIVPLDWDEVRALLEQLAGHRLGSMYLTALMVGLRQSEAIGLRWALVDLDASELRVEEQLYRGGQVRPPKTKASRRTLALPTVLTAELVRHRERQQFERRRAGPAWQDRGLVWCREDGSPLAHSTVLAGLYRACDRAGIRRVSFHCLRHTAATLTLATGSVDSRTLMGVLGHTSTQMTARYQQVVQELKRGAADAMDDAFRRRITPN